jgi:hypothetical protein
VKSLRAKLAFLVLVACQLSAFFGEIAPFSWWDGP